MSDYETLKKMLEEKLPAETKAPWGTNPGLVIGDTRDIGVDLPEGCKLINLRLNGFIFDADGELVDIWAEYD